MPNLVDRTSDEPVPRDQIQSGISGPTGAYTREEWTSIRQIGECFAGVIFTPQEYDRVERAYLNAALAFLREGQATTLTVENLENHQKWPLRFNSGSTLNLDEIADVIRQMLQERFWCRLQARAAFIHIGWDYYMYVGVPRPCPSAQIEATSLGLFVEECQSPYKNLDSEISPPTSRQRK